MCGIAGVWNRSASPPAAALEVTARAMADALRHRGPDDGGTWVDAAAGLALGHRRLSILDLSPAGHQPMVSEGGTAVICYNGEIYNFTDLRRELEPLGWRFRGGSDTEVMLAACEQWGVEQATQRFIGMFAFALWDARAGELHLVRDRLGIKPLYYMLAHDRVLFGSELKALHAAGDWRPALDRDALAGFMRHGYVAAPRSIWQGVAKLEPGCILTIGRQGEPRLRRYWDALEVALAGLRDPLKAPDTEVVDRLETLLADAVGRRMVADVPLGAFLSGGIDSSTVVALMQSQSSDPVRTFSIGFDVSGYDEARHARAVAEHLGTRHTELYVTPEHAMSVIPRIPTLYDEPFADSSQIPTFLVSEMTRRHVTVSLSGDGGDELFAGYNRYRQAAGTLRRLAQLPGPLRRALGALLHSLPPAAYDRVGALLPPRWRLPQVGNKAHKVAALLGDDERSLYLRLVSLWDDPEALVRSAQEPRGPLWDLRLPTLLLDPVQYMQHLDTVTYLPDDILAKVDRASMAVSLEARVPLIDHRVVEFAWRLPAHCKVRGDVTKWALRQVLYRHVPRALVERPKMGFGVPIDHWLRGPLREWAEGLLAREALEADGLLDAKLVRERWREHLEGGRNHAYALWNVLVFQAWRERWC